MFPLCQYTQLWISEKGEPLMVHKSEAALVRLREYSKTSSEADSM